MEHVCQLNRIVTFRGDEVLDANIDIVTDPDVVAAAVLAVSDGRLLHAEHFADQRPEHRGRPAELPGQEHAEPLGLAVGRGVIQVDAHPPVALVHDRRRVQEQGKAQAADVNAIDIARLDVIGEKRPAPVERRLRRQPRPGTRADRITRTRLKVRPVNPPCHGHPLRRNSPPDKVGAGGSDRQ